MQSLTQKLLANRGIENEKEIEKFLYPNYELHLHDPFLLPDMDKAVERILRAIQKGEKIIFYTDYDTDGIPAGVLLHDFFKEINYTNFENYIPHRNDEGYGLNINAILSLSERDASLIITADCGITDNEEVEYAKKLGIDVIITDHHLPHKNESGEDILPKACAVVNPKRADNSYPFPFLCGAGVAFKLIQGILKKGREGGIISAPDGSEKWLLDMVAIATVSDRVPLIGENRVLTYYGLKVLRKTRRPGLRKLFQKAYAKIEYATEEDIGFTIGPRINVASRIDTPRKAFALLSTRDEGEAEELVTEINALNEKRKGLVAGIMKEAKKKLGKERAREVILFGNTTWHPGLVGLAAQNLVSEYKRPVFVWGRGGGKELKGSCRSDGSVNLVRLMEGAKDLFSDFGGHEGSGGFSIMSEKLHLLEERLISLYAGLKKENIQNENKNHCADEEVILENVTWNMFGEIDKLAPFGEGNPRPVFLFRDIVVAEVQSFGKEKKHTKLLFRSGGGAPISAIKFFTEPVAFGFLESGVKVILKAHVEKDMFRNSRGLRLRIVEIEATPTN